MCYKSTAFTKKFAEFLSLDKAPPEHPRVGHRPYGIGANGIKAQCSPKKDYINIFVTLL